MSDAVASLKGVQIVLPDGTRNDINFGEPALFTEHSTYLLLGIELDHLDYKLRIRIQINKADGAVLKECIAIHKQNGGEQQLMFMPYLESRITNTNRRAKPIILNTEDSLRERLKQYPESVLFGSQPATPPPCPSKRKFP